MQIAAARWKVPVSCLEFLKYNWIPWMQCYWLTQWMCNIGRKFCKVILVFLRDIFIQVIRCNLIRSSNENWLFGKHAKKNMIKVQYRVWIAFHAFSCGSVKVEVSTIQSHKRCRGRALMSRSLNSPAPACSGCPAGASYRSASRPSRTALPVKQRKRGGPHSKRETPGRLAEEERLAIYPAFRCESGPTCISPGLDSKSMVFNIPGTLFCRCHVW